MVVFNGINLLLLFLLGSLPIYWAFGGAWGLAEALPQRVEGAAVFRPGKGMTLLVAFALLVGAALHAASLGAFLFLPLFYQQLGLLGMGLVFLLRAIGDFNYVGLFKKERTTHFAKKDSRYYTPLCILLAINALISAEIYSLITST